ncbi:MAG: aminotransferase class I/II-fold pyridoxal phosphate-dependent enzyme [Patescibacteria group bacterium]
MPNFETNPDLKLLGTETAFGFGAEVMAVEKTGKFPQIYKFHIGDTGPKTPEPIINTAIQALKDKQTKYAHFQGYPQVRSNIARHWTKTRGVEIKPENIILTPGGKPVIEMTMQALLVPGDYVVGQNPGYPIYESLARFYSHGNYLPWLARHNADTQVLEFFVEDLEKILQSGKKIKLLVVNTPQNPTGMVMPRAKLEAIAELAKKHHFMVLFDDIYDQIIFNKEHFSLLSVSGMLDYTINLNGYAKNYAMTGWRLGFAVAPEWLIKIFGQLAINKWSCVNRVDQIAAGAIYGDVELDKCRYPCVAEQIAGTIKSDVALYEKKGKFLVEALRLLSPFVTPNEVEGAFYDFPNIAKVLELPYVKNDLKISSDKEFSHWLLYEQGLAALAGSDFGEGGRGHLRFSYSEDHTQHIIPGIKHFIKIVIDLIAKSGLTPPLKMEEVEEKVNKIRNKYNL